ncbi:1-phosphofructokinase family hexose kinase [Actinokineospora sp. 24-640]
MEDLDGQPDVHVHAGGQGVWQARMVAALGVPVVLCGAFGGETGQILRHLVDNDGVRVQPREVTARNGAYVHDRRDGSRSEVVEMTADPLTRHELDDLYALTLREAMQEGTAILSGTKTEVVPSSLYERLVADLTQLGCRVVVDLSGDDLAAARAGGPTVIKVSHEELIDDGEAEDSVPSLVEAAHRMSETGALLVMVSRADQPALARTADNIWLVEVPQLRSVDHRGAGDSMTAAITAALATGDSVENAIRLGAAAGATNVTRHGLGTGDAATIRTLAERVTLRPVD